MVQVCHGKINYGIASSSGKCIIEIFLSAWIVGVFYPMRKMGRNNVCKRSGDGSLVGWRFVLLLVSILGISCPQHCPVCSVPREQHEPGCEHRAGWCIQGPGPRPDGWWHIKHIYSAMIFTPTAASRQWNGAWG